MDLGKMRWWMWIRGVSGSVVRKRWRLRYRTMGEYGGMDVAYEGYVEMIYVGVVGRRHDGFPLSKV